MKGMLWEIMVPTQFNNGKPIRVRYHRVWDQKVYSITGGLTICKPANGRWVNSDGKLFSERMIPVRIMCTREQIKQIAEMTCEYYDQEAVMYHKISDEAEIVYRKKK
jgi:hypothetical protein